ncbi:MAG: choice-of-anchor D domain-containing protein [Acidobacteriota bacterium]
MPRVLLLFAVALTALHAQGPRIGKGGVVDAAQFQAIVSPGGIATVFGSDLAGGVVSASTVPLTTALGGVRVFIHGIAAPLFFVAPTQINFQVPFEVPPGATVEVVVERDGAQSPGETVRVEEYAPAVFQNSDTKDPIATHFPDNAVITGANPAKGGDVLILYLTGVGGLTAVPTTGDATPASPLPTARIEPAVTLGGQTVTVLYAGLSPLFIGLAQLNLKLPATLPSGAKLPLIIRFGAATGQTVQLPVQFDAPPVPAIRITPASIDFGDINIGQSAQRAISMTNAGTAPLTIQTVTSSNPRFSANIALPLTLSPGAIRDLFVTFQPTSIAAETGTITIGSNDPATPQFAVAVSGRGAGSGPSGGTPAMSITPASLAFGDTGVGTNKDMNLTIRNTGAGILAISAISPSQPQFTVVGSSSVAIAGGGQQLIPIRFTPTAAGLVTGALTIASNDPARPAFTVPVTGTGFLTGAQTLVLQIDDGTFERTVTIPDASEIQFVNRLTPPRYPATLKAVQIFFPEGGLVLGDTFTLLSAAHTSGAVAIGTPAFRTGNGRVAAIGEFVEIAVPELTITSGDFLVGFATPVTPTQRPVAVDISGYQSRSYVSTNGSLYEPVHLRSAASQGNFAIRAVVGVQ